MERKGIITNIEGAKGFIFKGPDGKESEVPSMEEFKRILMAMNMLEERIYALENPVS